MEWYALTNVYRFIRPLQGGDSAPKYKEIGENFMKKYLLAALLAFGLVGTAFGEAKTYSSPEEEQAQIQEATDFAECLKVCTGGCEKPGKQCEEDCTEGCRGSGERSEKASKFLGKCLLRCPKTDEKCKDACFGDPRAGPPVA